MRRRGKSTAARARRWAPIRQQFLAESGCAVCGAPACDLHEILAGAHRQAAFVERATWLRLCRSCHDWLQGTDLTRQLAYKLLSDPEGFDLEKFHDAWGRPQTAITSDEVLAALRSLLIERQAA